MYQIAFKPKINKNMSFDQGSMDQIWVIFNKGLECDFDKKND